MNAFPGAGWADEQAALVLGIDAAGDELGDELAIELLIEVEIEGVERLADAAEAGVLDEALEEAVLAPEEFVADEGGEGIDRGRLVGRIDLAQRERRRRRMALDVAPHEAVVGHGETRLCLAFSWLSLSCVIGRHRTFTPANEARKGLIRHDSDR